MLALQILVGALVLWIVGSVVGALLRNPDSAEFGDVLPLAGLDDGAFGSHHEHREEADHGEFGWSPDAERLPGEGDGIDDPSRNDIYSIVASAGGELTRITWNPDGTDIPGDYSPDGTRFSFMHFEDDIPTGLFVVDVCDDGAREGEAQQLTPEGMVLDDSGHAGRWSPDGEEILFVARETEHHHNAIWVVNAGADGGAPTQLPIAPGCGGPLGAAHTYGCYSPDWSPDGDRIVFTRSEPDGSNESIWIVNADGSGLVQVTSGADDGPVWGTPPTAT